MATSNQFRNSKAWLPWMLVLLTSASAAQTKTEPEPLKPALPTQLQYSSPIGTYQAYEDQPVQSWRDANDRVGRIGGWRAYAKEIETGEPASPKNEEPTPSKNAAPAKDPHAGHHGGSKP